jgi:hypothetical protein
MKNIVLASLIALALGTTAAGCRPHMSGMMMHGMEERSSGENPERANAMMGHMPESGILKMPCCEQCPMMKGKGRPT